MKSGIMFLICKDTMLLNTVEKKGFQFLMKKTVLYFKIPSRRTITQMIDDKYDVLSLRFREKLFEVESICLTTDIWTNTHNTKRYISLTGHFIHEGELLSINFGVSYIFRISFSMYNRQWCQYCQGCY